MWYKETEPLLISNKTRKKNKVINSKICALQGGFVGSIHVIYMLSHSTLRCGRLVQSSFINIAQ